MTLLPLRTFTGRDVNITSFSPDDVDVADIAHALSLQTRFGGHCAFHYSVAQHSILVAHRVHQLTADVQRTRRALLHDAHEAYTMDIPRPLKYTPLFEPYRNLCRRVQFVIEARFNCHSTQADPIIEHVDRELLYLEGQALFAPPLVIAGTPPPWRCVFDRVSPAQVPAVFIAFFLALSQPHLEIPLDVRTLAREPRS